MVAIALYATNPAARRRLERLAAEQDGVAIVGVADSPAALTRLLDETRAEIVLAEARPVLSALLAADPPDLVADGGEAEAGLTPREVQVLAAMADGASNKMIARRLGISFHTVKFHVASILAKLDADTRTEAVAQGARLGLVML
jgi:DNA-binding CsgD family transcriptional regulator